MNRYTLADGSNVCAPVKVGATAGPAAAGAGEGTAAVATDAGTGTGGGISL